MIREKIDIHNTTEKYRRAKDLLCKDPTLSKRNKECILQFLHDAALGKTVLKKQKKKIDQRTCLKYLHNLKTIARCLKKDFDKVDTKKMEQFICALEEGTITNKKGIPYSSETKKDFKVALKKFYKWLLGNNETYPDIVKWLDTFHKPQQYPSLTEEQIEQLLQNAKTTFEKALISVLFDLGARIEEFLNIKREDLIKTETGYKIHIRFSKTFARTLPLDTSIPYLEKCLEESPQKDGQVFPISYRSLLYKLRHLGQKTLSKPVTPHMIRHSKATHLAQNGVGRYQMCQWMGWTMSSTMPDRYISREGIDNEETLAMIKQRRSFVENAKERSMMQENMSTMIGLLP